MVLDLENRVVSKAHRRLEEHEFPIAIDPRNGHLVCFEKGMDLSVEGKKMFKPYHFGDRVVYVCAKRGAGKSTFCSNYIDGYRKTSDNPIFFISRLATDESIKIPDPCMRVTIADVIETQVEDYAHSLMVFDDIHSASLSSQQINRLQSFIIDAIENSRHYDINILITSHQITNYSKTRAIMNELSDLVIFPRYSNAKQILRALRDYLGLGEDEIDRIMNSEDRWVMIHPTGDHKFVLSPHHVYSITGWVNKTKGHKASQKKEAKEDKEDKEE
jgi:hypothetical protein